MSQEFGTHAEANRENHHHGQLESHHLTISVNDRPVKFKVHEGTGHAIKREAIDQGVPIEESFLLFERLPDGGRRLVGNDERVHLRNDLHFRAEPARHEFTVTVNEQPVRLHGKVATGAEIKTVAIRQGVLIQQNFILQEELPNGTSRVIGDNDQVHLREHLRFTAIPPDDNS